MSDRDEARRPLPQDGSGLAVVYSIAPSFAGETAMDIDTDRPRRRSNGRRMPAVSAAPLRRVLEAIFFAVDRPVTVEQLLCAVPDETRESVEEQLEAMTQAYKDAGFGFRLERAAGGYQLRTDPEMHEHVSRFLIGKRRTRLSRAAMETLAIVAYRQPITRGEIEEIRGVDCGQVMHTLLERDLVLVRGRSQALGRPLLYATTPEFLTYFGINSLADLPSPEELESLLGSDPLEDPEIRNELEARGLFDVSDGDDAADAGDAAPGEDAAADHPRCVIASEPTEDAPREELPPPAHDSPQCG